MSATTGCRFWFRTAWWAFTHPFSSPDDNPGVQATLDELVADVERLTAIRIADWLRHVDRFDDIPSARVGMPHHNPLWDAALLIEQTFLSCEGDA